MALTGNTTTLTTFTTIVARFTEIAGLEETLEAIKDSHLGTLLDHTYIPGDLRDRSAITFQLHYDPNEFVVGAALDFDGTARTTTITYPTPLGGATGATLSGTAFITRRSGGTAVNDELMVEEFDLMFDGKTGPVYAAST